MLNRLSWRGYLLWERSLGVESFHQAIMDGDTSYLCLYRTERIERLFWCFGQHLVIDVDYHFTVLNTKPMLSVDFKHCNGKSKEHVFGKLKRYIKLHHPAVV